MQRFMLWNVEKVCNYMKIREENQTAMSILLQEEKQGDCTYSIIRAKDDSHAREIARACYNETDIDVRVEHVPDEIQVAVYDVSNYVSFDEAQANGAVYLMAEMKFNDLFDASKMAAIDFAISVACRALTDDAFRLEKVVVSAEQPDKLYAPLSVFSCGLKTKTLNPQN